MRIQPIEFVLAFSVNMTKSGSFNRSSELLAFWRARI